MVQMFFFLKYEFYELDSPYSISLRTLGDAHHKFDMYQGYI